MNRPLYLTIIQWVLALAAALFGLLTIFSGGRVLLDSDPGYTVFRPLLIFNTTMGVAYVAAGIIAWRSLDLGKVAAAMIFVLNFLVLAAIIFYYAAGGDVAIASLRAMTFRTVVWFVLFLLFLGLAWISHRNNRSDSKRDAQPLSS